ncbi:MAG: ABC transporter ATP-binding protein [Firmicutes bacterium]|nr:ABC transporter ATP-binding protein [Bacillota bacterium]
MSVLECKNLKKKFGKKEVIRGVSFKLEEGDILGFIGPNGAGKTTTIKLILGLQKIDEGTALINGFDIKEDFVKAIERVGTIVENPDMYMYLTGKKNLLLSKNLYKNVTNERIDEVVKLVGLENRINDKVSKYSLGMRQRLGIAQAILHHPNLLILDEPTNGLDPEGIIELRNLLKKLAKEEKIAILISGHNLLELESFCNKVCIIKNGEIIEESTIKELKKNMNDSEYKIEVNNTKKIKKIFKDANIVNDNEFTIKINKEEINDILSKLISNDIKIYSIKQKNISLEDVFIEKTGGNIID